MSDNILHKVCFNIPDNLSNEEIIRAINDSLDGIDTIYSYLLYVNYVGNQGVKWKIEYILSQVDKYNTLSSETVIKELTNDILFNNEKKNVFYKQPSIDLMIELYDPLMKKLTLEQCKKWNDIEYEDMLSLCRLTMLKLYNKGYYVHRQLLKRSFENSVLMELRHNKNKPEIISLEQVVYSDGDNKTITMADIIPDKSEELRKENDEDAEIFRRVFDKVKDILVESMGERQFEQLLRDYGNKHTTTWSRKKMQQIKDKFKRQGINWKSLGGIE